MAVAASLILTPSNRITLSFVEFEGKLASAKINFSPCPIDLK